MSDQPLLAIAAYHDWHPGVPPGMVKVIATPGGSSGPAARRRAFLVPERDYNRHPWPMPIDPDQYQETT